MFIQVEVDDDGGQPTGLEGSPEEAALLTELDALLVSTGDKPKWVALTTSSVLKGFITKLPLWCLRARDHSVAKAAELLPRVLGMMEELEMNNSDHHEQLTVDLESQLLVNTGAKDAHGRPILWWRSVRVY